MSSSLCTASIARVSSFLLSQKHDVGHSNPRFSVRSQRNPSPGTGGAGRGGGRSGGKVDQRVWRRRKLTNTKRNPLLDGAMERVPFLEERMRTVHESGGVMGADIERLLLSEDNRFAFVNDVVAEAVQYMEKNRDEYGHKKPILHVISNRINDLGFKRDEAYLEIDPVKPRPGLIKELGID
ncbi:PLASTID TRANSCRIPTIONALLY ACTIVE 7-like protein [Drosera capensis]